MFVTKTPVMHNFELEGLCPAILQKRLIFKNCTESIECFVYQRKIQNDNTIQFNPQLIMTICSSAERLSICY